MITPPLPPAASLLWGGLLGGLLAAAGVTDVRARRIPNALVAATLAAGLARGVATGTALSALAGAAAGLALWLPLYALRVMGAGDVKLFAAAAAWLGPAGVLPATLYTAVAGGALGLVWVARARLAPWAAPAPAGQARRRRDLRLPYGLAIGAGVLAVAWGGAR